MPLDIVIMAAGLGTRMRSGRPKVLHTLAGRSLLAHVLGCVRQLKPRRCVVVTGHGAEEVEQAVSGTAGLEEALVFVRQQPQLGTGHAVMQALPHLGDDGVTLVLNGDVPLIEPETCASLVAACGGERLALLTVKLADPTGYGRVVRHAVASGQARMQDTPAVRAIVEHKDADAETRAIGEVYTGIMAAPTSLLRAWIMSLKQDNAQNEYYLTDVVAMAAADGIAISSASPRSDTEVRGVNSPVQLAELERLLQRRRAEQLMEASGVRLADPARFDLRGTLACGRDVEIDVGCVFEGGVVVGDGARIGAYCVIRDAEIEAGATILPYTHIDGARVGEGARVGPYARLRPGADLGPDVHIGNFVEVKNAVLARGAKANHLAYVGDATVGEGVNFGAGSITANYDGVNKHHTVIGNDAHVGSNCVLVAPVTIGEGATIGAGSTITRSAPAQQLTVVRATQVTYEHWKRPRKR